ncbi:hypothetical protein PPYR_11565 [Photinus pyralis]|uniref:RCC1 domain-containing protein 1 n=1 Tax=Photinus pyralis TaxID=7054 RepID=A0A1Y1M6A7_PHOPY|nr:RCC1 domain-containing protein 1 [Photinus pyralis]KAB0794726.1 hypothetical protein PPYR_11565 [Photinus pyralis]
MKLFCCGFNLYRQFECSSNIIRNFVECTYDRARAFTPGHTYNLTIEDGGVFMLNNHKRTQLPLPNEFKAQKALGIDSRCLILSTNGVLLKYDLTKSTWVELSRNISKIAFGNKLAIALDSSGSIFNLPLQLEFNRRIIDMATGCEHCLLLDESGRVYSFGRGSRGQLGHGSLADEDEPKLIDALDGIKIKKIAAGGWHSCAVSVDGDLYSWGWNGNGQLGIYNDEKIALAVMACPHIINFDDDIQLNVVDVACGRRHTVVFLSNRKLYGAGWNKYCQLTDVIRKENVYKMEFLYDFSGVNVEKLMCGPWSTVLCVSMY